MSRAVILLWNQFDDLASRLDTLYGHRHRLKEKFGKYRTDNLLEPIDDDLRYLNQQGWKLVDVTKRFLTTIKPELIDAEIRMEVAGARKEAMNGLRSFEKEIDKATQTPDRAVASSLEEIVAQVDRAVKELERAINR